MNENMDNSNEEIEDFSEESETGKAKQWLQDNLRIIISVLIVVVIAGGIYSYSNRTEAPLAKESEENNSMLSEITGNEEQATAENTQSTEVTENQNNTATENKNTPTESQKKAEPQNKEQVSSTATSQETEKSFVESAAKGDNRTTLARRALANYLEKNPDSALTPEHKIYIEDYLQKNSGHKGGVRVGTSVEFGKDLIQGAISKSKNLNENQLNNLHKYAVRVPSLS